MEFKEPHKVYTAESNIEAHLIVELLGNNGIDAYADEDVSGASLFAFGRISQFHLPNVWVEKSTTEAAARLIQTFEEQKRERAKPADGKSEIQVECEECGKPSTFPDSLNGTTQDCPHCAAYIDVGELDWEEDFGVPEE